MRTNTRGTLNALMEFDHVVHVLPNGNVTDADTQGLYAPEVHVFGAEKDPDLDQDGWTLWTGYTGQYGYNGPVMHPSEYIGGQLEQDIRNTPGYYAAVVVTDLEDDSDDNAVGWALAYREER